jgi:uncharacterized protein (TIGR04255 family)
MGGPKYPNQQLRSVSLETHFPGELRALSAFGEVQDAVRSSLPNLFVPNVQAGEAPALRPFQLRNADQSRSLALAVNQATYVSFSYPGYESFAMEAVLAVSAALRAIKPPQLNRVVYRYENELLLAEGGDGSLGVERIFPAIVPKVFAEGALAGPAKALNASFEHAWQADGLKGVRGFSARADGAGAATVFRITVFGAVEGCGVADLERATAAAHRAGIELFEALISPSFRDFISSNNKE